MRLIARLGWRSRLAVTVGVLVVGLAVRHHLAGMDERFFRASLYGAEGLLRYMVGDYAGAARAYRADHAAGYEPLTGLPSVSSPEATKSIEALQDVDKLLTGGEAALARGDLAEAERVYMRVLAIEAGQYDALLLIAVVKSKQGHYGEAIEGLNRTLPQSRSETRYTTFLAALETTGELTRLPASSRPLSLLAHYHRYLRRFDHSQAATAIGYAKAAIANGDHADDCWFTIGEIHRAQGKPHAALDALVRAVALNPRHAGALHAAGNIYEERGDLLNERRMRAAALAAAPNDVFYAEPLLDLLILRAGDYREAVTVGETVRAREPRNAVVTARLGEAYGLLGEYAVAERYLRDALEGEQRMVRARYALAWTLLQQRKYDEAIKECKAGLALAQFGFAREFYRLLAGLYQRQRRYRDVVAVSSQAIGMGLQGGDIYAILCSAYYELNALGEYEACVPKLLARYTGGVIPLPSVPEAMRTLGLPLPIP